MVWRNCLIWSARAMSAGKASSAKRAPARKLEAGEARRCQPIARRLARLPRRLQPVAQHLGDDAVLFGERWEGNFDSVHQLGGQVLNRRERRLPVKVVEYELMPRESGNSRSYCVQDHWPRRPRDEFRHPADLSCSHGHH